MSYRIIENTYMIHRFYHPLNTSFNGFFAKLFLKFNYPFMFTQTVK